MSRAVESPAAQEGLALQTSAERAVIIGTVETARQARQQIGLVPEAPEPVGCILVDRMQSRAGGGLPVFGSIKDLPAAIHEHGITLAVVSLPMSMADVIHRVRTVLREHGVAERFIPPIRELLLQPPPYTIGLGTPAAAVPTEIEFEVLTGREPHPLDRESIARLLTGRRVLITGAGGSIGSEMARIAAEFQPAELQLIERSENPLFEVDRKLGRRAPNVQRRVVLHDVVEEEPTLRLLSELRPDVVFHAAAHKHVPLMEDHPAHAVNNNLFGTRSIADAAAAVGAERFVMVSTDKAVNPTSVMGATKRLAELYIQARHEESLRCGGATRFSMVRFGNVLGSACSVLTIWSAQLAEGGPITVTDPRMTRYFMTISEAAGLVIQAAAIERAPGDPAAVHVLDMGRPVPILELARRFLRAHGFEARIQGMDGTAGGDSSASAHLPLVDVVCTGVRPGEKIHEELAYAAESLRPTPYPGINAWAGDDAPAAAGAMIADLGAVRASPDREAVLAAIRRHVPEMVRA